MHCAACSGPCSGPFTQQTYETKYETRLSDGLTNMCKDSVSCWHAGQQRCNPESQDCHLVLLGLCCAVVHCTVR